MRLWEWDRGAVYSLWVVDLSDDRSRPDCPVLDFMEQLGRSAPRQRDALIAVLEQHMEYGQIRNTRKSNDLGDGIHEFKESRGGRLVYFYMPGWRTVLTEGFKKGARVAPFKKRALELKRELEDMNA